MATYIDILNISSEIERKKWQIKKDILMCRRRESKKFLFLAIYYHKKVETNIYKLKLIHNISNFSNKLLIRDYLHS